jgi:hypothetical protein
MMRAIGHRYQELEYGGLSKAAARKLRSLADAAATLCRADEPALSRRDRA